MYNCKYFVVFRGDDTDFAGNQRFVVELQTELDLTGMTAHFRLLGFQQDFDEIPQDKKLEIVIPASSTSKFPLGSADAEVWLIDSDNRRRTVANRIHFIVTNSIREAYDNDDPQAITVVVSGGGGTVKWDDIEDKPDTFPTDVDDELSDESENPVQNKVVTEALEEKVSLSEDWPVKYVEPVNGVIALENRAIVCATLFGAIEGDWGNWQWDGEDYGTPVYDSGSDMWYCEELGTYGYPIIDGSNITIPFFIPVAEQVTIASVTERVVTVNIRGVQMPMTLEGDNTYFNWTPSEYVSGWEGPAILYVENPVVGNVEYVTAQEVKTCHGSRTEGTPQTIREFRFPERVGNRARIMDFVLTNFDEPTSPIIWPEETYATEDGSFPNISEANKTYLISFKEYYDGRHSNENTCFSVSVKELEIA